MIQIQLMCKEEVAQVARLEKDNFSSPWSENDFLEAIDNPTRFYYVAKEDETVVGMCGMQVILDEGEISNVAVSEKYRRKQIAYQMLSHLLEEGKKQGVHAFTLEVRESNQAAIRLYEKLGFVAEGIRKNFYTKPIENAVIMWKR